MPWITSGLVWLLTGLGALLLAVFKFLLEFVAKRFSLSLVAVAAILTVTGVFFAGVSFLVSALSSVVPPELSAAVGLVLPSNFPACMSAILGTSLLRFGYQLQMKFIGYKNAASGF